MNGQSYPFENNVIEQLNQFSLYETSPLVKDKYLIFEWDPGIPIRDNTREEAPVIINEDDMDFEDVAINDNYNGQE